jgi:hypothetical protein
MLTEDTLHQSRAVLMKNGNPRGDWWNAPRCAARTRRGTACRCPAMRNRRRCRLHGGKSTGPKTAAGIDRIRAARTIHGNYSRAAIAERKSLNAYMRQIRATLDELDSELIA